MTGMSNLLLVVEVGVVANLVERLANRVVHRGHRTGRRWGRAHLQLGNGVVWEEILRLLVLCDLFKTLLLKLAKVRQILHACEQQPGFNRDTNLANDGLDIENRLAQVVARCRGALAIPARKIRAALQVQQGLESRQIVLNDGEVLVLHCAADLDRTAELEKQAHKDTESNEAPARRN